MKQHSKSLAGALSLLLAVLTALSALTSCTPKSILNSGEQSTHESESTYEDPFVDVNYNGRTFCIQTSENSAATGLRSSNYLIQGNDEFCSEPAADAAIKRNLDVMNRLNIKLVYVPVDYSYETVVSNTRKYLLSGDNSIQLIINDISLTMLSAESMFHDAYNGKNFDFDQPWWYDDFMSDISLDTHSRYILAGDYFIDMLRTTHCLVMNRDLYRGVIENGDPDDVYQAVRDGTWTLDYMNSLISGLYIDTNGNRQRDRSDTYMMSMWQYWGPIIPWIISADPGFIERDENGYPVITLNNERSASLNEKLNDIFHSRGSAVELHKDEQDTINAFVEGRSLFLGYQRFGSLESECFANADLDLAVLPYPKLDENQADYVSSIHDTTELGYIPGSVTYRDMDFVSAVIEVLCRETYNQVIPQYYESTLKIRYAREAPNAEMIDIIHDHYGNGFPLAWSGAVPYIFLTSIYEAVLHNNTTFASNFRSHETAAREQIKNLVEDYKRIEAQRAEAIS